MLSAQGLSHRCRGRRRPESPMFSRPGLVPSPVCSATLPSVGAVDPLRGRSGWSCRLLPRIPGPGAAPREPAPRSVGRLCPPFDGSVSAAASINRRRPPTTTRLCCPLAVDGTFPAPAGPERHPQTTPRRRRADLNRPLPPFPACACLRASGELLRRTTSVEAAGKVILFTTISSVISVLIILDD